MPKDRRHLPLEALVRLFCRKYCRIQRKARLRRARLKAALACTHPELTRRISRLEVESRIAAADIEAAQWMLDGLHRDMPDTGIGEASTWLSDRIGQYNWREEYRATLVLATD